MERASDGSWTVHASAQSASQPSVRGLSGSSKPQEVQHQHQQQAGGSASWLRPPQPSTVGSAATKPPRSSRSSCTELAVAAATRLPAPPVADLVPRPAAPLPPRPPQGAASPQPQQPVQQPMNGHGGLLQPRLPWLAALSAEDAVRYSGSGSEDAATVAHSTNSGPLPRPSACADRSDSSQRGNSGPLRLLPQRASALTPATAAAVVDAALGPDALSAAEGLLFVSAAAPEELLQPLAFQQQLQLQPDEEGLGSTQPPSLPQDLQLWCMGRFKVVRKLYEGYASRVFRASCLRSGAEVALKAYDTSGLNTFLRHQVLRELDIHARLTHTSIVQLYAVFKEGDILVMVQEYVRGGSLDRAWFQGSLSNGTLMTGCLESG
eukprot:XP_001695127.1 predicted protein [Chlamydomonas reinhardtii]